MTSAEISAFVERQRRERVAAGFAPTITDHSTLALIAAVIANKGGERNASAA